VGDCRPQLKRDAVPSRRRPRASLLSHGQTDPVRILCHSGIGEQLCTDELSPQARTTLEGPFGSLASIRASSAPVSATA